MQNKINILSTRPLSNELIEKVAAKNIYIECLSFIETEMFVDEKLQEKINDFSDHSLSIVFTSMNAVEAVAKYLNDTKPNWKIYCIGNTTRKLAEENFGENVIAGTADSASALADVIISEKNISSIVFFCGDQRRDELPEKLLSHQIEVKEIVVYKTLASSHQISKDYDGIIFYSPSAVNSFFSVNKINDQAILFAIGNTTATEIKKFTTNKIITANKPSKQLLAEQAIKHFETNPIHH
jgi:uroporphyrinogen-III synthase